MKDLLIKIGKSTSRRI